MKLGTTSTDAPAKSDSPKVLSIGSKPAAEPKEEELKPAKIETPKPEAPKIAEKKADSKPSSRSSTPKPTKKVEEAIKAEEKVDVEEDLEAVDDEVLEDLYGKEHLNVVFMGHVGQYYVRS